MGLVGWEEFGWTVEPHECLSAGGGAPAAGMDGGNFWTNRAICLIDYGYGLSWSFFFWKTTCEDYIRFVYTLWICICLFFLWFQFGRDLQAFSKAALATWPHYGFSCFAGSRHGKFYQKHSSSWIWTQLDRRFTLVHPLQWSCFWQVQSENHTVALRNKSGNSVTVKGTDPDRLGGSQKVAILSKNFKKRGWS